MEPPASEEFTLVTRRSRRRGAVAQGPGRRSPVVVAARSLAAAAAQQLDMLSSQSVDLTVARVQRAAQRLPGLRAVGVLLRAARAFVSAARRAAGRCDEVDVVCLGAGSLRFGSNTAVQLALLLCLRDALETDGAACGESAEGGTPTTPRGQRRRCRLSVYDPLFDEVDAAVLALLDIEIIAANERGFRRARCSGCGDVGHRDPATAAAATVHGSDTALAAALPTVVPTIFYLPHCPHELTAAVLASNYRCSHEGPGVDGVPVSPALPSIALLCNGLSLAAASLGASGRLTRDPALSAPNAAAGGVGAGGQERGDATAACAQQAAEGAWELFLAVLQQAELVRELPGDETAPEEVAAADSVEQPPVATHHRAGCDRDIHACGGHRAGRDASQPACGAACPPARLLRIRELPLHALLPTPSQDRYGEQEEAVRALDATSWHTFEWRSRCANGGGT
jgi:hypothetical protein